MRLARRVLTTFALVLTFASVPMQHSAAAQAKTAATAAPQGDPLDINTATRDQLKALPGIGNVYADRIIKGRPYAAKSQLSSKGIIPDNVYAGIQGMIVARRVK